MPRTPIFAKSAYSALGAMIATFLYEATKTAVFPHLTIWQSHAITIIYCSLVAYAASIIVLHLRQREMAVLGSHRKNFETIIEHLPGVACIVNRQGKLVRWTARGQDVLGYSAIELSRMLALEIIAEEYRPVVSDRLQQVFQTGYAGTEAAWITKGGQKVPCYLTGVRVFLGSEPCVLGIAIDLSDQKRAEAALCQSEEQFRRLLANLPDVTWTIDSEGRITYISSNIEDIFGYTPQEVLGGGMAQRLSRIHPDDAEAATKRYRSLFLENRIFDLEYRTLHKDGRWIWVRNRAVRTYQQGGALFADGILSDISERKQAESVDAELASIVRSSGDAIFGASADGIIQSWNPAAETMFGYSPQEAIGHSIAILIPPERKHELAEVLGKIARSEPVERFDSVCRRKGGSRLDISLAISPIVDKTGAVLGISTIAHDISRRKQAEADLMKAKQAAEDANRAKTRFLANMSHELRTPMNGILAMAELALDTTLSAEQREYLLAIESSGNALLHLITELLDFTRTELGSLRLETVPFHLPETVRQTVRPLFLQAEQMGLQISLDLAMDLPDDVIGDPARLRQVLVNLLGNAVKFTYQGKIALRAQCLSRSEKDVELLFTLSDTGIGIPAEKHHLIFEPFMQHDGSSTRSDGGTGLGLAISSRLVELMGGKIWLDSELGRGSTFYFTVRLELLAAPALVLQD